jgi:hypothetical protein
MSLIGDFNMKKIVISFVIAFVLFPVIASAQMDIVGFINSQEPVASWTTVQKVAFLNDLCSTGGYQETIVNEAGETIPNPITKKQFANRMIIKQVARWINGWRKSVAESALTIESVDLE